MSVVPRFDDPTILLVEIDVTIVEAIDRHLRVAGVSPVRVTSIQAALECLEIIIPDLILSNLQLCQDNGFLLLNKVRAYEQRLSLLQIPVIAIVEHSDREGEIALEAGFQAYIRTPIHADNLYTVINQFAT